MTYDDDLIEQYRKMVYSIAWQYTGDPELVKDLFQEGFIGLRIACKSYDPEMGTQFSTHAYWKITNQIKKYVNNLVDEIHTPRRLPKAKIVEMTMARNVGCNPQNNDIEEALSKIDPDIAELLRMHYFDKISKVQMSEMLGIKYQTMHSRMKKGLQQLKILMGNRR